MKFTHYFKCPSCFVLFEEKNSFVQQEPDYQKKLCDFCVKEPKSIDLLYRQIEIMENTQPADFPKIIKHLIQHVNIR